MNRKIQNGFIGTLALALFFVFACSENAGTAEQKGEAAGKAVAVLQPTKDNNVKGTVTFTKAQNGVRVLAAIEGLSPGKHGFHIHEYGDCSAPDATSAGDHFNPHGAPHGAPTDVKRHVGDLGNVEADISGKARLDWVDPLLSFEGKDSIIGRSIIVHAEPDDLKTQPTGGAGARVACGVIGFAKQ